MGTASSPHAVFATEELCACGDRGVVRRVYRWDEPEGRSGHVRGVDIFRVREGKVAGKFSSVKGQGAQGFGDSGRVRGRARGGKVAIERVVSVAVADSP